MSRGFLPPKPIIIVGGDGDNAAIELVNQKATDAQTLAANVRQMLLNRDPLMATLEEMVTGGTADVAALTERLDGMETTPGADGRSAYDIAKAHGYTGTEAQWLASLKGDAGAPTIAIGTGRLNAALLLGGSADVTVTLSRTMPNTTYQVGVAPTAGMTLVVKTKTTTTITVTVSAGLALAVGATFSVIAWT